MKKKWYVKVVSILLCFMCVFCVGCGNGDGGPSDEIGDEYYQSSMDGAKVLTRPADYNFAEAVGKHSEHYYNLFAREILYPLYYNYNVFYKGETNLEENISIFTKDVDTTSGETYGNFTEENNKYYLYDSLRYTITNIATTTDGAGNVTEQTLTLDLESGWDWGISYDAKDREIVFTTGGATCNEIGDTTLTVDLKTLISNGDIVGNWQEIYGLTTTPDLRKVYAGDQVPKPEDPAVTKYFKSPYYESKVENVAVTTENFYQDALEYATYLFVLGYDYVDDKGAVTEDAPLFDFKTEYDDVTGKITDVKVGGWGATNISVVEALEKVKAYYKELGNFIGVTEKNKEQITRFVLDKVIGEDAYAKNIFEVATSTDGVAGTPLKFNRNYDQIVKNIVDYACAQAPIGYDETLGQNVTLDSAFLTSTITDYAGDYFYVADGNDPAEGEVDDIYRYISPAEYQNIILYPKAEDVGKRLTDIHLGFEYFDYEELADTGLLCDKENGLTINVGVRYYDSTKGEYTFEGEAQINVKYGREGALSEEFDPDINSIFFTEDDMEGDDVVKFEKEIRINTQFNNNIGEGAINPFVSGTLINLEVAQIKIDGDSKARDYYMLNNSSSYGFYGTLNPEKFSKANAGEDGCDYIEVYFDVVKEKGVVGKNYNYKVGIKCYYAMGDDDNEDE